MARLIDPASLTDFDRWYLSCFTTLAKNLGRPPSTRDLAAWLGRSVATIGISLRRLAFAGELERDDRGRYHLPGAQPRKPVRRRSRRRRPRSR